MTIIKIGRTTVNLDNATEIVDWLTGNYPENDISIFFNCQAGEYGRAECKIKGDDATALRAWLARNSTDIATENNNHQVALDLAQELCDVLGAMEVADADEAHAHELLTGLIDTYWHPLRLALDATRATGS